MKFKDVFQYLIRFFNQERIDYALIGAFALKAYGYVRATQDVDFLVRRNDKSRIIDFLESLGYETLHRSAGFSNHLHSIRNLGRIDFVYVEGDTADSILSDAKSLLVLDDVSIPVVRVEHLIALKVFAMKNDPSRSFREMADIQHLLGIPGIDRDEVRIYFEKYGLMEKYYELTEEDS